MSTSIVVKSKREYVSATKIALGYNLCPDWAISKWLSNPETLEYINAFERANNSSFDHKMYLNVSADALSMFCYPTLHELIDLCNVHSILVDKDFCDEIYLDKHLAFKFAKWISPAFSDLYFDCKFNNDVSNIFRSEKDFVITVEILEHILGFKNSLGTKRDNTRNSYIYYLTS